MTTTSDKNNKPQLSSSSSSPSEQQQSLPPKQQRRRSSSLRRSNSELSPNDINDGGNNSQKTFRRYDSDRGLSRSLTGDDVNISNIASVKNGESSNNKEGGDGKPSSTNMTDSGNRSNDVTTETSSSSSPTNKEKQETTTTTTPPITLSTISTHLLTYLTSLDLHQLLTQHKKESILTLLLLLLFIFFGGGPVLLYLLTLLLTFICNIIGLAISIGLALGFASHVHDTLDHLSSQQSPQDDKGRVVGEVYVNRSMTQQMNASSAATSSVVHRGGAGHAGGVSSSYNDSLLGLGGNVKNPYHNLMRRAGYSVSLNGVQRGQFVEVDDDDESPKKASKKSSKGVNLMNKFWPTLPKIVNKEIGMFMDLIIRDYVICWFSRIDTAVEYIDPATVAPTKKEEDGTDDDNNKTGEKTTTMASTHKKTVERSTSDPISTHTKSSLPTRSLSSLPVNPHAPPPPRKKKLISTRAAQHSPPFIDALSLSLSHVLGELSVCVGENVNVMELLLINVVKALGKSLKVYREMKKMALERSYQKHVRAGGRGGINAPSEMAIGREFLRMGRLHKALTFGMDYRSLLCTDPLGEEDISCPRGLTEDEVLERRLFGTGMLSENELDYCRVVSHRLCRKLMQTEDYNNQVIRRFVVEVLGGCLLMPIMGFFVPETINGWIVMGVDLLLGEGAEKEKQKGEAAKETGRKKVERQESGKVGKEKEVVASSVKKIERQNSGKVVTEVKDNTVTSATAVAASSKEEISNKSVTASSNSSSRTVNPATTTENKPTATNESVIVDTSKQPVNETTATTPTSAATDNPTATTTAPPTTSKTTPPTTTTNTTTTTTPTSSSTPPPATTSPPPTQSPLLQPTLSDDEIETPHDILSSDHHHTTTTSDDDSLIDNNSITTLDTAAGDELPIVDDDEDDITMDDPRARDCTHIMPLLSLAVSDVESILHGGRQRLKQKQQQQQKQQKRRGNTNATVEEDTDGIDWDNNHTKMVVCQLVLVIEAALKHGRKVAKNVKVSFSDILTEMTIDMEAFREKMTNDPFWFLEGGKVEATRESHTSDMTDDLMVVDETSSPPAPKEPNGDPTPPPPEEETTNTMGSFLADETVTLRTLVATWLQQGHAYDAIKLLCEHCTPICEAFYHDFAFFRQVELREEFRKCLSVLHRVDILVHTMEVLSSTGLETGDGGEEEVVREEEKVEEEGKIQQQQQQQQQGRVKEGSDKDNKAPPTTTEVSATADIKPTSSTATSTQPSTTTAATTTNASGAAAATTAATTSSSLEAPRPNITKQLSNSILRGWADTANASNNQPPPPQKAMSLFNVKANIRSNRQRLQRWVGSSHASMSSSMSIPSLPSSSMSSTASLPPSQQVQQQPSSSSSVVSHDDASVRTAPPTTTVSSPNNNATPPHLVFHKNEAFAASLRSERDRRMDSWRKATIQAATTENGQYRMLDVVHNRSTRVVHRELHLLARNFYTKTVGIGVELVKGVKREEEKSEEGGGEEKGEVGVLLEAVGNRRMIEVPDDDSSFLLRAQPRPLDPIGTHIDDRNTDATYKCYATSYEEPTLNPTTHRYIGGRYIRHCLLKYYPSNRTATVNPLRDNRNIQRGAKMNKVPALPESIRTERNLCCKPTKQSASMGGAVTAPSSSGGVLMSNLIEPNDFNATPRTGKAIDFVFRCALFERPVVEIGGRRFIVTDGNKMGVHRADASCLELSDASLSVALLMSGDCVESEDDGSQSETENDDGDKGDEGSPTDKPPNNDAAHNLLNSSPPMVYIKVANTDSTDPTSTEIKKSYRPSFIRAALMVASARQDAQLQCLIWSVRRGSARKATRARTEALLQPTLNVIDFATSKKREKESILLRDLKLGINHVDREQLRRNGVLHPRYPTFLRGLNAKIESFQQGKPLPNELSMSPAIYYKIRCVALAEIIFPHDHQEPPSESKKRHRKVYRIEWAILRPFRDFIALHKHLKSQVATAESSAGQPRFAAATAAILTPGMQNYEKPNKRKALIPSLSAATKAGALAMTKKALDKRRIVLNEYISYLLSRKHLMKRCPELLMFLGADVPLPVELMLQPEDEGGEGKDGVQQYQDDPFGRMEVNIQQLPPEQFPEIGTIRKHHPSPKAINRKQSASTAKQNSTQDSANKNNSTRSTNNPSSSLTKSTKSSSDSSPHSSITNPQQQQKPHQNHSSSSSTTLIATASTIPSSVKSRVEKVQLSTVRDTVFEFIRHQFDLDNATFFRSRLVAAIRTMSFVVTSSNDFNKTLLDYHTKYVNGESIAWAIGYVREILWPGGVWFTPAPLLTEGEKVKLNIDCRVRLGKVYPEQLKRLLGMEITTEGLDLLHEMLQNRLVLKSLGYIIMDMLWQDIFPDLDEVLTGMASLDFDG